MGRPLDDGWRQWVAENRLRGCTPDSMLATMTGAGLDPQASVAALDELERNPVYLAALRHQQLLRKLESVVGNLQTAVAVVAGLRRGGKARPAVAR